MRRLVTSTILGVLLGGLLLAWPMPAAAQEDTLAKIKRTNAVTIGYRESSPPFSFVSSAASAPSNTSCQRRPS